MTNTLGILGLGSRSTVYYIDQINLLFQEQRGGYSTCPFTLFNLDFNTINPFLPTNFNMLIPQLNMYLDNMEKFNISHLIVPNITLHECVDRIRTNISIIHPIHATAQKLQKSKQKNVLLFASKHSMESNYIQNIFNQYSIQVAIPNSKEIAFLDKLRVSIYNRTENMEDIHSFQKLVTKYANEIPVVIACTELSIPELRTTNLFDMADIHIENALHFVK